MRLNNRLNKLEKVIKPTDKEELKPDFEDFTVEELRLLDKLLDNGQEETPAAQELINKIKWVK